MVTAQDIIDQLEAHPLVARAHARMEWTGSWNTMKVACLTLENTPLDSAFDTLFGGDADQITALQGAIDTFHRDIDIGLIRWNTQPRLRSVLRRFIDALRMAGQEIWLEDPVDVPVLVDLTVLAKPGFYRSEIHDAVMRALGTDLGGYFSPARLKFGEDLHASDLIAAVMDLDGVQAACLNRFKRLGEGFGDQSGNGLIVLEGTEVAICDNDANAPARGLLRVRVSGGQAG